jgi:hypothetical protein
MSKISNVFTLSALATSFTTSRFAYFSRHKSQASGVYVKQSMLVASGAKT